MEKVKLDVQGLDNNLSIYNSSDIANMYNVVQGAITGYMAYIDSDTSKTKFDSRFSVVLSDDSEFQARCFNVHPETEELVYPLALFEIVKVIDPSKIDAPEDPKSEASTDEYAENDNKNHDFDNLALLFRLKFASKEGDLISVLDSCREFAKMLEKLVKIRTKREQIYNEK